MKHYKIVVSKDEHKKAWNQAGLNNFAYGLSDIVCFIAAVTLIRYGFLLESIPLIIGSILLNAIFFRRIQNELIDKGIIEEVAS